MTVVMISAVSYSSLTVFLLVIRWLPGRPLQASAISISYASVTGISWPKFSTVKSEIIF
jgi:hypothetical protein